MNHKKIKRLMREHDLQPRMRRRYVATTDSDHDQPIFPNRAKDMTVDGPDQLWVSDITYVAIATGFVYVAVVLDAWSRRVVGYAISRSIDVRLTLAALKAAIDNANRARDAYITPIAARNTLPSSIAMLWWCKASSARWAAAVILTTTPKRKAS